MRYLYRKECVMPKTEKTYPEWVQMYRTRGTTVKRKGDQYYLYKRTSRRIPGKKYPQPVDTYIGIITPQGVIKSEKKKISITDVEVYEYGFSKALLQICPEGWKKPLGEDWEDVLKILIQRMSPQSYLLQEGSVKKEEDMHHQISTQMSSLSRRIYRETGFGLEAFESLKTIYLIKLKEGEIISKINPEQQELIRFLDLDMEVH